MKIRTIWVAVYMILFVSSNAFSCEPCAKELNFDETVQKANAIIIGQKTEEGPRTDSRLEMPGGPDWVRVRVIESLKGEIGQGQLKVNSWDSMCDYGIIIDDKSYVMFLAKRDSPQEGYQYDAVDYGCSVKTYMFEDGLVDLDGTKISLEDFRSKLKPQ